MIGIAGLDAVIRLRQAQVALQPEPRPSKSHRLGDRVASTTWDRGFWMADFSYITTRSGRWSKGREPLLDVAQRKLPLFLDSSFRRFTGTAPAWANRFEAYLQAIERVQPDGFLAWDYPDNRAKSLAYLEELATTFHSEKLWPIFSVRWAWDNNAHLTYQRLPGWASCSLASLIPPTHSTQRIKSATLEGWARLAIANAVVVAQDPDFRAMVDRYGKVALGGMVQGPMHRPARHLYIATLTHLFPGVRFWALGQANHVVLNGLGLMDLLDDIWTDGSWWLVNAVHERVAYIEDGLIQTHNFEVERKPGQARREPRRFTFFSRAELQASHLRSLLGAVQGLWAWPGSVTLPTDLIDEAARVKLRQQCRVTQMELASVIS